VLCAQASAADHVPAVALRYHVGVAGFLGDLSGDQGRLVNEAEVDTLFVQRPEGHLRGYLGITTLWTRADHDGSAFPFDGGAELNVLGFLFMANLCGRPDVPVSGCLGLGNGTVNVNEPGDRRDYGTWNYLARVDVEPWRGLVLTAQGRYIGRVEQQVAGVNSAFALWTAQAGAGWQF
jgi:hypothetical protein